MHASYCPYVNIGLWNWNFSMRALEFNFSKEADAYFGKENATQMTLKCQKKCWLSLNQDSPRGLEPQSWFSILVLSSVPWLQPKY